jgi:ribonuclease D
VQILPGDITPEIRREIEAAGRVAWDIETNGLDPKTARIGTCQLFTSEGGAFVVTGLASETPPNLSCLLANASVLKVFHHAPFDLSFMAASWGASAKNVACTKIAAKLLNPGARAEDYSLKHLMMSNFDLALDKSLRFTDWLSPDLTRQQVEYAIMDVAKLLDLYDLLRRKLEGRQLLGLYERCCAFLSTHVEARLHGVADPFRY